jgi:transposase InsO family protein
MANVSNKAFERFQTIACLVNDKRLDSAELARLRRKIAQETEFSEITIRRWEKKFKELGLEGLEDKKSGRPGKKVLPQIVIDEAKKMREENPKRSLRNIIIALEHLLGLPKGSIKRTTLHDNLAKINCTKTELSLRHDYSGPSGQRFQRKYRNDLWQTDFKHAVKLNGRKTYLITYIDDATRYIVHSVFVYSESIESVLACLRKAVEKCGKPLTIYCDNGSAFKSGDVFRTLSKLHIQKLHCKPRRAQSKGKIEKFHQVVDKFISELKFKHVYNIDDLNYLWGINLETYYQSVHHDGLPNDLTPYKAYNMDDTPQRFVAKEDLDEAFLIVAEGRRVDKSGCVNFRNRKWIARNLSAFIGRKVNVIWDPVQSLTWISPSDGVRMEAEELVIKEFVPKGVEKPAQDVVEPKTPYSVILAAAEINCQKISEEREKSYLDKDFGKAKDDEPQCPALSDDVMEYLAGPPTDGQMQSPDPNIGVSADKEEWRPMIDFKKLLNEEDVDSPIPSNENGGEGDDEWAMLLGAFDDRAGDD